MRFSRRLSLRSLEYMPQCFLSVVLIYDTVSYSLVLSWKVNQLTKKIMPTLDPIHANPLAVQLIPQVERDFAEKLKLTPDQRSIGLLSVDNDHATYVSIDEATKMAAVEVVYAR